jgi:NADPH:quinone reductase-like Zn-dependent oxidoreductase
LGWGHCGIEKLKDKNDIVVPIPKNDELFIRVKGAGINNRDINTIIGLEI